MHTPYSTLRKYLTGTAVAIGVLTAAPAFADDALDQAMKNDNNWATYGRTFANTRFSPLNQVTDQNVGQLKLAYAFQLGALRSNEATPYRNRWHALCSLLLRPAKRIRARRPDRENPLAISARDR